MRGAAQNAQEAVHPLDGVAKLLQTHAIFLDTEKVYAVATPHVRSGPNGRKYSEVVFRAPTDSPLGSVYFRCLAPRRGHMKPNDKYEVLYITSKRSREMHVSQFIAEHLLIDWFKEVLNDAEQESKLASPNPLAAKS